MGAGGLVEKLATGAATGVLMVTVVVAWDEPAELETVRGTVKLPGVLKVNGGGGGGGGGVEKLATGAATGVLMVTVVVAWDEPAELETVRVTVKLPGVLKVNDG